MGTQTASLLQLPHWTQPNKSGKITPVSKCPYCLQESGTPHLNCTSVQTLFLLHGCFSCGTRCTECLDLAAQTINGVELVDCFTEGGKGKKKMLTAEEPGLKLDEGKRQNFCWSTATTQRGLQYKDQEVELHICPRVLMSTFTFIFVENWSVSSIQSKKV